MTATKFGSENPQSDDYLSGDDPSFWIGRTPDITTVKDAVTFDYSYTNSYTMAK